MVIIVSANLWWFSHWNLLHQDSLSSFSHSFWSLARWHAKTWRNNSNSAGVWWLVTLSVNCDKSITKQEVSFLYQFFSNLPHCTLLLQNFDLHWGCFLYLTRKPRASLIMLGEDIAAEIEVQFLPWLKLVYNLNKILRKVFHASKYQKKTKKQKRSHCVSKSLEKHFLILKSPVNSVWKALWTIVKQISFNPNKCAYQARSFSKYWWIHWHCCFPSSLDYLFGS